MKYTYFEDGKKIEEEQFCFCLNVVIVHDTYVHGYEKVLELTRKDESINTNDPI